MKQVEAKTKNVLDLSKEGDEHRPLYLGRRYMYLLDILPLAVSIGVFSLALSYAKLPKQKVTFVCVR